MNNRSVDHKQCFRRSWPAEGASALLLRTNTCRFSLSCYCMSHDNAHTPVTHTTTISMFTAKPDIADF